MKKINIGKSLASIDETWAPRIAGRVNDVELKLVKLHGDFVWHKHDETDELFLVVDGRFDMLYRDGGVERVVTLERGEFVVVPLGMEHCPVAAEPCSVLLIEAAGTVNTGDAGGERTREATHL